MRTSACPLRIPLRKSKCPPISWFEARSLWVRFVFLHLQRVLCPQTPCYGKQAFVASQSRAHHTAAPRYQQWCHFVLSALLPALTKLRDCQTCTAQDLCATRLPHKPTHTFPGKERLRCTPFLPKRAVLSFCRATYIIL